LNKPLAEIRSVPTEYSAIYADGSKNGDSVAPAAVFGHQVYAARLSTACSIFSAEANAILLALKFAVLYFVQFVMNLLVPTDLPTF
jgi:hypothetical protein